MSQRTRQSQAVDPTTESPNEGHAPLQSTTDIDVPLHAVGGRHVNPKRSTSDLGKKRTCSTSDTTPPTQAAPPAKRARKNGKGGGGKKRTSSTSDTTPAARGSPPATRARKNGSNVGCQEKGKAGGGKKRTSSTTSDTTPAAQGAPPAKRARKKGSDVGHQEGLEVGATEEEDEEQERARSVSVAKGKRPQLQRSYAFYGRPSQNDQPQANTTNGDSDSDIENEADWHDEPNLEGLAPRHRSKISQAMIIETPIWQVSATLPGLSTSEGTPSLSQTGVATSRQASGHATSHTSQNNSPSQQSGGSDALSSQGGGSVAPVLQGGGTPPPSQDSGSIAPSSWRSGHVAPSSQGSGSAAPLLQGSGSVAPSSQGSGSVTPLSQGSIGVAPLSRVGGGSAPPLRVGGVAISKPEPIPPVWPADTDLVFQQGTTKIVLMAQQSLVRIVIQDAMEHLRAHLLSNHAFPGSPAIVAAMRVSLLASARSHFPGALSIHSRIHADDNYVATINPLLRARIPLFRSEVKEECAAIVAAELRTIGSPARIKEFVECQLSSYNYTFPMAPNVMEPPKRNQPYQNDRIITVIRNLYFTGGPNSFSSRFSDTFPFDDGPSGVIARKVPIPMVALVATALYAALHEWRTGVQQATKFSTNTYFDVYHGHIMTFNSIHMMRPNSLRLTLTEIYSEASEIADEVTVPVAELDWEELEE